MNSKVKRLIAGILLMAPFSIIFSYAASKDAGAMNALIQIGIVATLIGFVVGFVLALTALADLTS